MMFETIKNIANCWLSPRLYNTHWQGSVDSFYEPCKAESCADYVIHIVSFLRDVSMYMSPFFVTYMFLRGINNEELSLFFGISGGLSCVLALVYLTRAWGRAHNPEYMQFITALKSPKTDMSLYLEELRKFDFEFYAWPATFVLPYNPNNPLWEQRCLFLTKEIEYQHIYQKWIAKFLAYIAVKTFALRLIYPGSLGFINYMLKNQLLQGRARLIERHNATRGKIVAADGNSIDTVFVDNRLGADNPRSRPSLKGNKLVICSEGNTGFYEVGIMAAPLESGYSVLGWNHPGFAGSTGLPYPRQEFAAIEAVTTYAIQELKFPKEGIVMFGWSIGGFTATWGAFIFSTGGLILDATFDDLMMLALKQMPSSWAPLVREVVRSHVNLDVAQVLNHFHGPVHIVRRTDDEMICLTNGDISTNLGNNLLVKLIMNRHGDDYLLDRAQLVHSVNVLEEHRLTSALRVHERSVHTLRLISKYGSDFKGDHCTHLTAVKFESAMRKLLHIEFRPTDTID